MKLSALFWPVELKGSLIYVLDETLLPEKQSYIKVKDYQDACRAIKDMKTRAVGQVILVLYTFLLASRKKVPLKKVAQAINSARPTLPFKVITDMVLDWQAQKLPLEKCILGFLDVLKNKRIQQAQEAADLVVDGDCILTHCNVSGLMPLIGEFCRK